jgi:hypothetical protein
VGQRGPLIVADIVAATYPPPMRPVSTDLAGVTAQEFGRITQRRGVRIAAELRNAQQTASPATAASVGKWRNAAAV